MSVAAALNTALRACERVAAKGDRTERCAARVMAVRLRELLERRRTGVDPVTRRDERDEPCPTDRVQS